jgi:hypothetical protein
VRQLRAEGDEKTGFGRKSNSTNFVGWRKRKRRGGEGRRRRRRKKQTEAEEEEEEEEEERKKERKKEGRKEGRKEGKKKVILPTRSNCPTLVGLNLEGIAQSIDGVTSSKLLQGVQSLFLCSLWSKTKSRFDSLLQFTLVPIRRNVLHWWKEIGLQLPWSDCLSITNESCMTMARNRRNFLLHLLPLFLLITKWLQLREFGTDWGTTNVKYLCQWPTFYNTGTTKESCCQILQENGVLMVVVVVVVVVK